MRNLLSMGTTALLSLVLLYGIGTKAQAQDASQAARSRTSPDTVRERKDPSKEGLAPDIQPAALWDGRAMVPFHTMDFPPMVAAPEADFLDDSDYILGVTAHGESRAYPTRFLWWHHAINDQIGNAQSGGVIPIAVTYCSVCNTGICYDPMVNGKPVYLDFFGLYNGVVTLCERETQSVFLQAEGRFVSAPMLGVQLKTLPLLDTTWAEWKRLHPDTLVMSPNTPYRRFYNPKGRPEPRGYSRFPMPFFRPTVTRGDLRLPPFDKVLAVAVQDPLVKEGPGSQSVSLLRRAYPLNVLQNKGGVINDRLAKTSIAVFYDPEVKAAVAVDRKLDGKTLSFEAKKQADGKIAYYDRETHTRWNIEGRAEEGPLAGKTLERVENHLSQWYGWAAYFPKTSIYGRRDRPQPGDPFEVRPAPEVKVKLQEKLREEVQDPLRSLPQTVGPGFAL